MLLRLKLHVVKPSKAIRLSQLFAVITVASSSAVSAQHNGLDLSYGRWWHDSASVSVSAGYFRQIFGPVSYGLGLNHLKSRSNLETEHQTGAELSVGLWRDGAGPYAVSAVWLGMRHSDGDFDTQWSVGGGYAIPIFQFMSIGLEARYRVEDRASRGFWRLNPADRRGLFVQARVSLGFIRGRQRAQAEAGPERDPSRRPPPRLATIAEAGGTGDGAAAALRIGVVETALEAMGTPYRWGGEREGGFDCSGLIMYAYREHGLILPRTSRDQARMGMAVDRSISALLPGDILGFSDRGGAVTHVGLYVGDGMFIHSSASGVKTSSLVNPDGDGRWWRQRWVAARRVIN